MAIRIDKGKLKEVLLLPPVKLIQVVGTIDATTTSTTYEDIPEMTMTFDLKEDSYVLFIYNAYKGLDTGDAHGHFRLVIDDEPVTEAAVHEAPTSFTGAFGGRYTLVWLQKLAKGTHIAKMQWYVSAGTLLCRSGSIPEDSRQFIALIFRGVEVA